MGGSEVDLTADELYPVKVGLIFSVVCAPAHWDKEKVHKETNKKLGNPGTSAGEWVITEEPPESWTERDPGNPGKCTEDNRRHWLLNC